MQHTRHHTHEPHVRATSLKRVSERKQIDKLYIHKVEAEAWRTQRAHKIPSYAI